MSVEDKGNYKDLITCDKCHKTFDKHETHYFDPITRKVTCVDCREDQDKIFHI